MSVDAAGWVREARHARSPNFEARPAGAVPSLVIVHNISLPPGEFGGDAIEALFLNRLDCDAHPYYQRHLRDVRVSAHFLIRRDGELVQFVSCDERAWHAGASEFFGRPRCNDFSIGIELEGADDVPFDDAQYATLAVLARTLAARYPVDAFAGHSDVAPGRKTDPGPHFDWQRFARDAGFGAEYFPFRQQ
ncbi:N-acetylmuramoyl-L-alanine amidase [Burkholderia multivorans]|nr:N-acetylmuramoyl-L-alanine amidase [Burkholderia multivorans]